MTICIHKDDLEQKQLILEYSKFLCPKKTLDIGAGEGRLTSFFDMLYVGIDKNRKHLKKLDGNKIITRAKKLPFKDKFFDFVFSCTVVMLNENAEDIIKEMARVSKRCVLFLEAKKRIGWAFRHPYEEIMKDNNFELYDYRSLRTSPKGKPLAVWLFRRKGSRRLENE